MAFVRIAGILNKNCCSGSDLEGVIKSHGLFSFPVLKLLAPELELCKHTCVSIVHKILKITIKELGQAL